MSRLKSLETEIDKLGISNRLKANSFRCSKMSTSYICNRKSSSKRKISLKKREKKLTEKRLNPKSLSLSYRKNYLMN
jgi:hypothetical protein